MTYLSDDDAEDVDAAAGAGEAAGAGVVVLGAASDFVEEPVALPLESPEDFGLALP